MEQNPLPFTPYVALDGDSQVPIDVTIGFGADVESIKIVICMLLSLGYTASDLKYLIRPVALLSTLEFQAALDATVTEIPLGREV